MSQHNAPRAVRPVLRSRPFERQDIAPLLKWFTSDHDVKQWAGPSLSLSNLALQLEEILNGATKWRAFSVFEGEKPDVMGHFQIAFDPLLKMSVLGRVALSPRVRGAGAGTELVRLAVKEGFANGAHRLELRVFTFNVAAIRVYEKVGFVTEGVFRDASPFGDTFWDVQIMGLLWSNRTD